jgi:hypothetical protein
MQTIEVDDEVFAHLQRHARAFVDSPNSTLRRVLGIESYDAKTTKARGDYAQNAEPDAAINTTLASASKRSKAPKAELSLLVEKEILRNGQKLYLIDYQANRVQKFSAAISGGDLVYNGKRYSMSSLAQELLSQVGFKSNAVRGPAHWATDEGNSVKDLWQQYLGLSESGSLRRDS